MIAEWELDRWHDAILSRWNDVNLYTMTRGINRFRGLAIALSEVSEKYKPIEDINDLVEWAENSRELSNGVLAKAIEQKPKSAALRKTLAWSTAVT